MQQGTMAKKKPRKPSALPAKTASLPATPAALLDDLRSLIRQTRESVAQAVNSALVLLHWEVGQRVRTEILKSQRATYGEEIVPTLSAQLATEFGNGFGKRNLFRMIQFAEVFPDRQIVAALSRQLSWSHFVEIIPLPQDLQRDFYAEMCRLERWSVRTLRAKIGGMLFERTAIAKQPEKVIRRELQALRDEDQVTPDLIFRDPYVLDFLRLHGAYSEDDLEQAILRDLENFILELGGGFTFVARQKRMVIGRKDYYLDLLFYHRILHRLVAIELKLEAFEAAHKGQMELYLRWLEKHEQQPGEEPPLGLILCADKDDEHVELLQLDQSGIRVASYLTDLPPQDLLRKKLHEAVQLARAKLTDQTTARE